MPFNFPATLVPLYALLNPRLLLPSIAVRDIRYLNFAALRDAGYRGAIFDKDNCLTLPHDDRLVPELEVRRLAQTSSSVIGAEDMPISYPALVQAAWSEALRVFGPSHILIVSNSAGTRDDGAQLQAESVSYHLRAPVLLHAALKPSYACTTAALSALPGLAPHELIVIGDRIFTDVVLAHRLAHPRTLMARIAARLGLAPAQPDSSSGYAGAGSGVSVGGSECTRAPLAVWTTGVWTRESMAMRRAERWLVHLVERWVQGAREKRDTLEERFVRRTIDSGTSAEKPAARAWFSWVKGALPKQG